MKNHQVDKAFSKIILGSHVISTSIPVPPITPEQHDLLAVILTLTTWLDWWLPGFSNVSLLYFSE